MTRAMTVTTTAWTNSSPPSRGEREGRRGSMEKCEGSRAAVDRDEMRRVRGEKASVTDHGAPGRI